MAHSPAFQFYPGDFTGDKNTIPMTTLEIGAYWLLICECWKKDNRLPNDVQELAEIARMAPPAFEKIWTKKLARCFRFDDKKKVFWHKRLDEEIKKQKAWSRQHSEAGKKGMAKRWKQKGKSDNGVITPLSGDITPNNSHTSSSSSSSSPSLEQHLGVLLSGVQKELGLKKLPDRKEWVEHGTLAFENGFSANQFLECFVLMRKQDWRKYGIKAKTVSSSLPDLDKIRDEVGASQPERLPNIDEIDARRKANMTLKPIPKAI